MNAAEISEAEAFGAGSELWIIKNDSTSKWWQEIDFRSGFLLSHCLYHHRKPVSSKVNEIMELTEFPRSQFSPDTNSLLIGTADHFLNKWILIWDHKTSDVNEMLDQILVSLKIKSIRFFSDAEPIVKRLKSSPKTSLTDITFIKNT